jgi:hypothetical protein
VGLAGWLTGPWGWAIATLLATLAMTTSAARRKKVGYVYFIEGVGTGRIKVGMTEGAPRERLRALQTGSPFPLKLRYIYETDDARKTEAWLHETLAPYRVQGEWFEADAVRDVIFMLQQREGSKQSA